MILIAGQQYPHIPNVNLSPESSLSLKEKKYKGFKTGVDSAVKIKKSIASRRRKHNATLINLVMSVPDLPFFFCRRDSTSDELVLSSVVLALLFTPVR